MSPSPASPSHPASPPSADGTHPPSHDDSTLDLSPAEISDLVDRVFAPTESDRRVLFLIDLPDAALGDHDTWRDRRRLALDWSRRLAEVRPELAVTRALYRNVRANNANLPDTAWLHTEGPLPDDADALDPARVVPFADLFDATDLVIAATELSTTAPLKLAAPRHDFRAATLPGFARSMVPALRLDYREIDRRVRVLAALLDDASGADFVFETEGDGTSHQLHLDLRHRRAHPSGGLVHTRGSAGNLPSGEAYIVPYEGEQPGDPSRSQGRMPVELDGEVVVYEIAENRAIAVLGDGPVAGREAELLRQEPAYGNLSELGLGVLSDFGIQPVGAILLDEKLGLHIAFGRSDHFGGQVGAAQFSSPEAVVHIDRVYLPASQPQVQVRRVDLVSDDGSVTPLMRDGRYVVDLGDAD